MMREERMARSQLFLFVFSLLFFLLFLGGVDKVGAYVFSGLETFLHVIPSVFPYLVLSSLVLASGGAQALGAAAGAPFARLFRLPPEALVVFLVGLLSGFPVGAKCAAEMYKKGVFSKDEAERAAAFCCFCAPPFLVINVGRGLFNHPAVGWMIFALQTVFSLIFGFFYRRPRKGAYMPRAAAREEQSAVSLSVVVRSLGEAALQTLRIGGAVVFFSAAAGLLFDLAAQLPGVQTYKCLFFGFFEMSSGISLLEASGERGLCFAVLIVCFSGLSVFMQSASFLTDEGVSPRGYLLAHLLCPCFVLPFSLLLGRVFGFFS